MVRKLFQLVCDTGIRAPVAVLIFHQFASVKGWRAEIDWINHYSGGLSFSYFAWKNIPFIARWTGTAIPPPKERCAAIPLS